MLKDIKTIKGYDVTIIKLGFKEETSLNDWFCAYVKLKGKLKKEYSNETYRSNRIIGIDTNHFYNFKQDEETKLKSCIRQITEVINEHIANETITKERKE